MSPAHVFAPLDGDDTRIDVRLVVAPSAGTFQPEELMEDRYLEAGSVIGHLTGPSSMVAVTCFCAGRVVRVLAEAGERVRPGQPLVWLR